MKSPVLTKYSPYIAGAIIFALSCFIIFFKFNIIPKTLTFDEIEFAKKVVEAFEAAAKNGKVVAAVEGRMIEELHYRNSQKIIETMQHIEQQNAKRAA